MHSTALLTWLTNQCATRLMGSYRQIKFWKRNWRIPLSRVGSSGQKGKGLRLQMGRTVWGAGEGREQPTPTLLRFTEHVCSRAAVLQHQRHTQKRWGTKSSNNKRSIRDCWSVVHLLRPGGEISWAGPRGPIPAADRTNTNSLQLLISFWHIARKKISLKELFLLLTSEWQVKYFKRNFSSSRQ